MQRKERHSRSTVALIFHDSRRTAFEYADLLNVSRISAQLIMLSLLMTIYNDPHRSVSTRMYISTQVYTNAHILFVIRD